MEKPISGDSEQREQQAKESRRQTELAASNPQEATSTRTQSANPRPNQRPMHGGSDGESAHGAIPRRGIEYEHGD